MSNPYGQCTRPDFSSDTGVSEHSILYPAVSAHMIRFFIAHRADVFQSYCAVTKTVEVPVLDYVTLLSGLDLVNTIRIFIAHK